MEENRASHIEMLLIARGGIGRRPVATAKHSIRIFILANEPQGKLRAIPKHGYYCHAVYQNWIIP
jgi:hypothetical protein